MKSELNPYLQYKDSDVQWLGPVPSHWEILRCKYLFREIDERSADGRETHLSMSQKLGLVPSESLEGRRPHSESYIGGKLCQPNDLVLNRLKAHLGVFARAKQFGLVSPDYTVLRPKHGDDVSYFENVFKVPACIAELRRATKGIVEGFWRLYTDDFYNIRVPVPPPDERATILRFVAAHDNQVRRFIRNRRRLMDALTEQKQVITNRLLTRGFTSDGHLRETGFPWLGAIPRHWVVKRLKYVMRPIDLRSDTGTEVLLSMRKHHGLVPYHDHFSKPPQAASLKGFKLVCPGQIVINRMQAGFGLIFASQHNGLVSPDFGVFQPTGDVVPAYLGELFRSRSIRAKFHAESTGLGTGKSGFMRLYDDTVGTVHIAFPPTTDEQQRVLQCLTEETKEIAEAVRKAERETLLAREYFTRLISDVVTGKLDIRELAPRPSSINADDEFQIDTDDTFDEELDEGDSAELAEEAADVD